MKITMRFIFLVILSCTVVPAIASNISISAIDATDDVIVILNESNKTDPLVECEVSLIRTDSNFSGNVVVTNNSPAKFKVWEDSGKTTEATTLSVIAGNFDSGVPVKTLYIEGLAHGTGSIKADLRDASNVSQSTDSMDVTVLKITLKEVSFGGAANEYIELKSDDLATTFSAPQWKDNDGDGHTTGAGEHNYSVAYVKDKKWKIGAKLNIEPASDYDSIKVKASLSNNLTLGEQNDQSGGKICHSSSFGDATLALTELTGTHPSTIKFYDRNGSSAIEIDWQVNVDDAGYTTIAKSKHQVYVSLDAPGTGVLANRETVFYLACKPADGESVAFKIVEAITGEFTSKSIKSVDPTTGDPDGFVYNAYGAAEDPNGNHMTTRKSGLCAGWAGFLSEVIAVHNINAPVQNISTIGAFILSPPTSTNPKAGGRPCRSFFPGKGVVAVANGAEMAARPESHGYAVPCQGGTTGTYNWSAHAIVRFVDGGNTYYMDPTYASPMYLGLLGYTDSLAGFTDDDPNDRWYWQPDGVNNEIKHY